jgi:hypothetical protein
MTNANTALTLYNTTDSDAQMIVTKGEQVVVFMPAIKAGQKVVVPSTDIYDVIATTVIDGNTYYSKSMTVTGPTGFAARVVQDYDQGTYVFDVQQIDSTSSSQMQFQSTWRDTVNFAISKDGKFLQNVTCADAFNVQVIQLGDTFSFKAIINGVTTAVQYSGNPNATCTAVNDTAQRNIGYYTLQIS